jgi:hypothetical protein
MSTERFTLEEICDAWNECRRMEYRAWESLERALTDLARKRAPVATCELFVCNWCGTSGLANQADHECQGTRYGADPANYHAGRFENFSPLNPASPPAAPPARQGEPGPDERVYPCADCGLLRSKNEGGTAFTVCYACWDRRYGK